MAKFVNKKRNLKPTAFGNWNESNTQVDTSLTALTSNKGQVLIGCNVANIHNATVTVDVALITDGSPDVITYIAKDVTIPVGANVELVDGTENSELAEQYNVMRYPTIVFNKNVNKEQKKGEY